MKNNNIHKNINKNFSFKNMSGKFNNYLLLSNKFLNIINAGLLGYGLVNKDYFGEKTFDVKNLFFIKFNLRNLFLNSIF